MLKKSIIALSLLVASSSVQAGPIVGAIAYWTTKGILYGGGCFGLIATAPVSVAATGTVAATASVALASTAGTVGSAATAVATVETISASVGAFFTSLPTF